MPSRSRSGAASRLLAPALLCALSLVGAAPASAAWGIQNCTPTTESTSPYLDACHSGRVNFFHRYDGDFNTYLYDLGWGTGPSAAFNTWWNAHADRAIGYDASRTAGYKKALKYRGSVNIAKEGNAPVADEAQYVLRSANDPSKYLYINYDCWDGSTCAAYAGDVANPAFRTKRINELVDLARSADWAGGYKGLWLDDLPIREMTTDGSNPNPWGLAQQTPARSPYLGRTMTKTDWQSSIRSFVQELRARLPRPAELLANIKWDPNVAGGGMTDPITQDIVRELDYVDLEGMSHDENIRGGTIAQSTYSFANLRDYIRRIHNVGAAVVWDDWATSPKEREFSVANFLLTNAGNDAVGLGRQDPTNWWAGYDVHLGDATTHLSTTWNGLQRRDFTRGIVLVNDPTLTGAANTITVTLPRPLVNTSGDLVTSLTLGAREAAVLRDPASSTTKIGAVRADFLTVNASSASVGVTTARGVAGPLVRPTTLAGSRAIRTGDYNVDGRDDLLTLDTSGAVRIYQVGVGSPNTLAASVSGTTTLPAATVGTFYTDVTGDKRPDLIAWNATSVSIAAGLTNGSFASPITSTLASGFTGNKANQMADMNGDGKADLVSWSSTGVVKVATSKVSGFNTPTTWVSQSTFVGTLANLACDITGDGKADLLAVSPEIRGSVTNATGTAGAAPVLSDTPWTPGTTGATYSCTDMDADGDADLVSWADKEILLTRSIYSATTGSIFLYSTTSIGPLVSFTGTRAKLLGNFDRQ